MCKKKRRDQTTDPGRRSAASDPAIVDAALVLRVGDHVRVRAGVRDPDFEDHDIGGWTGQLKWVGRNRGPKTHVTVKWDRGTRIAIPIEIKQCCDEEGVGFDEMDLDQEDLERIGRGAAPGRPPPPRPAR
jgi:hypothetical protein